MNNNNLDKPIGRAGRPHDKDNIEYHLNNHESVVIKQTKENTINCDEIKRYSMPVGNLDGFIKKAKDCGDLALATLLEELKESEKIKKSIKIIYYYLEKSISYEIEVLGKGHDYHLGFANEEFDDYHLEDIDKAFRLLDDLGFFKEGLA